MHSQEIERLREQHARDAHLSVEHLLLYEIALQLARLSEGLADLTAHLLIRQDIADWEIRERFGMSLKEIQEEAER